MPMMPFIGVRISWLMFARNSLFALVAFSAASLAFASSCCAGARSVQSRMIVVNPIGRPSASRSSDTDCSSDFSTPLIVVRYSNALSGIPVFHTFEYTSRSVTMRSSVPEFALKLVPRSVSRERSNRRQKALLT